ncbi:MULTISPECIES: hypothetical protein [unclassified Butyrivibrio]|uniref:hypothetical protein n=1 Tax=unclassified Butyrivibrio TaxID=2639466 RepID=UPI0003FB4B40|nr:MULTISPECIES: hypothetical protein [unclassified Butyrivibrio]SDB69070.1 hypothetical protein SAMN02910263_04360 [Butyrivibrio sp. INlla16]SEK71748.1 hypothetical protein SAMN04487770_102312 [Butyrivibrio sp. ob235]
MKKVVVKVLSLMLAFMMVFGAVGMTASAANKDKAAKKLCKEINKGGNKCKGITGNLKVTYKKEGSKYNFTIKLDMPLDAWMFDMSAKMQPKEIGQARDSVKKVSKTFKKKAKKVGIKKSSCTYIVYANGTRIWEFKDGKVVYDRYQ